MGMLSRRLLAVPHIQKAYARVASGLFRMFLKKQTFTFGFFALNATDKPQVNRHLVI